MIKSQAIHYRDFSSKWYMRWSVLLKQENGLYGRKIHNKAWQNAIMLQALYERGYLEPGRKALGFGVGTERLPSALAALGLKVTATDQELHTGQKDGWDAIGQLAHTRNDLNQHGIASKKLFDDNVTFENCDMNNISRKFNNTYDIIWSNCALGHLGSIENSLKFIKKSLATLKPGGIAIHTTEINVVSNDKTLSTGGTVIFRREDFINLFHTLRSEGYQCAPLSLDFGSSKEDYYFSSSPYEDEPLLKLSLGGHLLSQMVLIIVKPATLRNKTGTIKTRVENTLNEYRMAAYLRRNTELRSYVQQRPLTVHSVKPKRRVVQLALKPSQTGSVRVSFTNTSQNYYYDLAQVHHEGSPLVIATAAPLNRPSKLATSGWMSEKSRPITRFYQRTPVSATKGIAPGAAFWADINLKAPAKTGTYTEHFCLVVEGVEVIADSDFAVKVVVKP